MKTCRACHLPKPHDDFYRSKYFKDGFASQCKACRELRAATCPAVIEKKRIRALGLYDATQQKVCSLCHQAYPATPDFFHHQITGTFGLSTRCTYCNSAKAKKYRAAHLDQEKAYFESYYAANKQKISDYHKRHRQQLRLLVLSHYSNGTPTCACCRESRFEFLTLDHIHNNGAAHKRQVGRGQVYYSIRDAGFPPEYQVLCFNCNCAKGTYGICPHEIERQST